MNNTEMCPNKETCKLPDNHPSKDHLCNVDNFIRLEFIIFGGIK